MLNTIAWALAYLFLIIFNCGAIYGLYVMIRDDLRSEKKHKAELENKEKQ